MLLDIIKGMIIGISNVIPGVSGGTMAVSMGIYDKIIAAVNHITKNIKKSLGVLLPYLIGMALGIILFSFFVEYLFQSVPMPTTFLFVGLIIGGIPVIFDKVRGKKVSLSCVVSFLLFFALVLFLAFLNAESEPAVSVMEMNVKNGGLLFILGFIASATMVIPGVSGSMILMVLGYYEFILLAVNDCVKDVISLQWAALPYHMFVFIPFGLGILFGIGLIAKLIGLLLKYFPDEVYSAILGLLFASPVAVLSNLAEFTLQPLPVVLSLLALCLGSIIAIRLAGEH